MKQAILTIGSKTMNVEMDMDSDLFSKEPIDEKLSQRIVSMEDENHVFYVTDIYDLFCNYEVVKIEKVK